MFVDKINLTLFSGSGGSGSISFSSKSSKTSPNGASGGSGGSIILKTNKKLFDYSHIILKVYLRQIMAVMPLKIYSLVKMQLT